MSKINKQITQKQMIRNTYLVNIMQIYIEASTLSIADFKKRLITVSAALKLNEAKDVSIVDKKFIKELNILTKEITELVNIYKTKDKYSKAIESKMIDYIQDVK